MLRTGKRKSNDCNCIIIIIMRFIEKAWKRMITKVTYVGEGFTRKPPKYERFIRPMVYTTV